MEYRGKGFQGPTKANRHKALDGAHKLADGTVYIDTVNKVITNGTEIRKGDWAVEALDDIMDRWLSGCDLEDAIKYALSPVMGDFDENGDITFQIALHHKF